MLNGDNNLTTSGNLHLFAAKNMSFVKCLQKLALIFKNVTIHKNKSIIDTKELDFPEMKKYFI